MNSSQSVGRRAALRTLLTTTAATLAAPSLLRANTSRLHAYDEYGWLRGFSIVPSWGARLEDAWLGYEPARMREELEPAKKLHANCIRLWIEFTAWQIDPEKVTKNFLNAVELIGEAGMKTMPCLFNRWHDSKFDYGGTYLENIYKGWKPQLEYVRALVTPLAGDARIMIWDLCNEPQSAAPWAKEMAAENVRKEHDWLADIARTVRECGARQPITIGTMTGANITTFADICDVLCGHPYAHDRAGLEKLIESFKGMQKDTGKPFLVNECIPGGENDAERGALAQIYCDLLAEAGFGWMGWALKEGKAISTRRDRVDANGIRGVGFHPFALKSGELRGGLEFMTAEPKRPAPWVKKTAP